jgi:cytochrome c biogenesis protein CcmG, thiol:disulfide interchange protein DsbE
MTPGVRRLLRSKQVVLALRVVASAGVVALAALLVWHLAHQPAGRKPVSTQKIVAAPNFDLPSLNGAGRLTLASLRGKVVVINFWASSCGPCKQEMPRIEAAARHYAKSTVFVGIDVVDSKGAARAFVKHYGATYPIAFDPNGVTVGPWGIAEGTPQTFFVDRRGRLIPPHVLGAASAQALADGIERALRT